MSVSSVSSSVTSVVPASASSALSSAVTTTSGGATGGDGTGAVATQMMQWVATVQDGSGASTQDKATAYKSILQTMVQSGPNGDISKNAWFQQSTADQRQAVGNALDTSVFGKQAYAAGQQFNQQVMNSDAKYAGGDIPPSASVLSQLNQLSPDQQQLVFAGSGTTVTSLDAWKAQLQTDQDTMAADYATDGGDAPVVKVTLSDDAMKSVSSNGQTATGASAAAASADAKALQTLTTSPGTSSDDIGLSVLQNVAKAQTAADARSNAATDKGGQTSPSGAAAAGTSTTQKAYQAGDRMSVTA